MISGEKILVTGVTGIVGRPIAEHLARDNEVWGVARFAGDADRSDPSSVTSVRAQLDAAGITTRAVDLGSGDFGELPTDFTYVLHLAWMRSNLTELQQAIRTNVEGPGLLLQHCRRAKAALVMSGMGIYSGLDDPWHAYGEDDPIGRGATAYAPTSPACKLGVESVARFCARALDLPVVITRLNTFMGVPSSFPGMHIDAVLAGREMVAPHDPNPHSPIHVDDMTWQLEALLDAAATPALITNWCGDEVVTAQDWTRRAAKLSGRPGTIVVKAPPAGSPLGTVADPTRRRSLTGPCRTTFSSAFDELFASMAGPARPTGPTGGTQ